MKKEKRFVIVGNGGAACHAAMAMRQAGWQGEIDMISDVDEPAFNPMLGPYYLKGRIGWESCFPFGPEFYRHHGIRCIFGSPVVELDAIERKLCCADGSTLHYDRCLIATGAAPVIPPIPGLAESSRAFPLRSSQSIRLLAAARKGARKLVVLGASLVGLKLSEIMRRKGVEVLLVDVAAQLLPRGAHPVTAGYLAQYLEQQGVHVMLGCSLAGLQDDGGGVCCFFPGSIFEKADFIAVCTGIRPNIGFVDRRQVAVDAAILIDVHSRTSIEGLYAAGDCAQGINPCNGRQEWLGTWSNACYQGRAAGRHMAGQPAAFPGNPPQHVSPVFDWTYAQLGVACRQGDGIRVETCGNPFKGAFRLLVYEHGRLVGANLINDLSLAGDLKRAILIAEGDTLTQCNRSRRNRAMTLHYTR